MNVNFLKRFLAYLIDIIGGMMEICYICAIPFIQTPINDVVWLCCDMKRY